MRRSRAATTTTGQARDHRAPGFSTEPIAGHRPYRALDTHDRRHRVLASGRLSRGRYWWAPFWASHQLYQLQPAQ
jgi:hypothetical protein